MKLLKQLIIVIISIAVVVFVFFYFSQKSIYNEFSIKKKNVDEAWNNFKSDLSTRDSLLTTLTLKKADSLRNWLQLSNLERNKKEDNLDLVFDEYEINKYLIANVPNQKVILDMNVKLNDDILQYNSFTLEYNKYISTFPNILVAKKNHFLRAKYFGIKYGKINEDAIKKSKERPEWAKGIDTN